MTANKAEGIAGANGFAPKRGNRRNAFLCCVDFRAVQNVWPAACSVKNAQNLNCAVFYHEG